MKKGLVMEGGAMRGMFTCGVIDVFMENGITFDGAVGISAGAVFGCNYKSKQIGRPLRYNKTYCKDKRYGSIVSLLKSGDLYDAKFCYEDLPDELDVFDTKTFKEDPMEFYVGATDVKTGKCLFHKCEDGGKEDTQWMRASASMPVVSRIVKIGNNELLDGGIADSIPLKFMEEKGYDRNVVILTQPKGYKKSKNKLLPLMRIALKDYPLMVDALEKRHVMYNHEVADIEKKEARGAIFVIRPPQALNIGRTSKDPEELQRVYDIGRSTALRQLDALKAFLNGEENRQIKEDKDMDQKVRRHFRFYGTVQGVGFRFQAMMAAESLGLTGWVKNENDGSVTMEIQGSEEEIQSAIDLIANSRFIRIERTESELIPLVEHESSFGAEYW